MFIGLLVGIFIGLVNGMFIGLVIGMFIGLINGLVIEPPSFPELLAADAARRVVAAVRRPRRTAQTVSVTSGVYPGRDEGRKRESIICYCGPGQDPEPSITVLEQILPSEKHEPETPDSLPQRVGLGSRPI